MAKQINKETGEVQLVKIHNDRSPRNSLDYALPECKQNIVEHYDFTFDVDSRELKIKKMEDEDRDAYIQSFASECGVYNILAKYALTGDASLLARKKPIYADLTQMPVDDLSVGSAQALAAESVEKLNVVLGTNFTQEELGGMSTEALEKLIQGVVERKSTTDEKKEEDK